MAFRLKESAIKAMRGQTELFYLICEEFKKNNIETVRRWVRQNEINGPLTTRAALELISDALNVPINRLLHFVDDETNSKRNESAHPFEHG